MHVGYLASGLGSPFQNDEWVEIINNRRAYAYASNGGIGWLQDCSTCVTTEPVVPGAPEGGFVSPKIDQAPWYDEEDPDSWGFFGVVGIEVTGSDDSTRTATITQTTTIGGVIGPVHYGPRTLVFRVLVVAADECSLQFGLNWLRQVCAYQATPCSGDSLTFFDCCPCLCDAAGFGLGGRCWADNYAELAGNPDCDPEWWPTTYQELRVGPPASVTEWCAWIERNIGVTTGPGDYVCCLDECVVPYLRQFHNTVVTEGPTVLNHPSLYSEGALAEVEFTITCGDPVQYAMPILVGAGAVTASEPLDELPAAAPVVDPFDRRPPSPLALATRPALAAPDGGWVRHEQDASLSAYGVLLSQQRLSFKLRTGSEGAERVRVGVWQGDERVAGYLVPYVPPRSTVIIDSARRTVEAEHDLGTRNLSGFVKDWAGGPARWPNLNHNGYRITVDQEYGRDVPMVVSALATPVGVA